MKTAACRVLFRTVHATLFLLMAGMLTNSESLAHHADGEIIEEIVVWGRAESQLGRANTASEGLVGYADFSTRPLSRVGELVEVVPGMVATQHSGEGKANQYYLRGMNLDHGTDFSAYFEGMPVNMRAHAHGQGYLDLNFLIPEIISTVAYRKGPYHADRGDFSTAGTTSFKIYDLLDYSFLETSGGSDDYRRIVSAGSMDMGEGHLLGAVEVSRNDGPWELSSEVEKYNLLLKYAGHHGGRDVRVILTAYDNSWNSTDQVPQRLVSDGTIDRFGFVDPTIGGESSRFNLVGGIETGRLSAGAYLSQYKLNLFGNFTYALEDPENGDQHEQVDRRWIAGGNASTYFELGERVTLNIGGDFRYDHISTANLYATRARERLGLVRDDSISWLSLGAFATLRIDLTNRFRSTVSLRGDYYDFDVDAHIQANGGSDGKTKVLPHIGAAFTVNDHLELYANYGRGFHSNDVRGVTITQDPVTGDPVDSVNLFVDQEGAEIGLRVESWYGINGTLTWFWLESDSELLFVGDSGSTEPSDGSKRNGLEVALFWEIGNYCVTDLNYSNVDSEFTNVPSSVNEVPNAHGEVLGAAITCVQPTGWLAGMRVRHFGDAPLTEDGTVRHGDTTIVNANIGYDFGHWAIRLDILNLLDAEDDDIAYYFESRVPGEMIRAKDVHFHPVIPRSFRLSVRYEW